MCFRGPVIWVCGHTKNEFKYDCEDKGKREPNGKKHRRRVFNNPADRYAFDHNCPACQAAKKEREREEEEERKRKEEKDKKRHKKLDEYKKKNNIP